MGTMQEGEAALCFLQGSWVYSLGKKTPNRSIGCWIRPRWALLAPLLTGAARALPARQRRKKIQALIFQQTLNKGEEEEG